MSVTVRLYCEKCRTHLWVGQMRDGKPWLYALRDGTPAAAPELSHFLLKHFGHPMMLDTDNHEYPGERGRLVDATEPIRIRMFFDDRYFGRPQ